jgi:uncharacterized protein YutE (UPF0331/DUF86 family)
MLERLAQLEQNIAALDGFRLAHTSGEVSDTLTLQWTLRYGLIESIQIVIDTACHVCSINNLGTPKNYGDCIRFLVRFGYIEQSLARPILAMIGLRNLLIHEYASIDGRRLYAFLDELDVFRAYAARIRKALE